jgi:hypothetical protein
MRTAKELDTRSGRLPGDVEDDMLGRIGAMETSASFEAVQRV